MTNPLNCKMLPCPFCGGLAEIEPWHGGGPDKQMVSGAGLSDTCNVGPCVTGETPAEAICRWNARDPALARRVIVLEEQVEALGGGCDANNGGLHSVMDRGKEPFCPDCGLMLKRVAYVLPHVKPSQVRAALTNKDEVK